MTEWSKRVHERRPVKVGLFEFVLWLKQTSHADRYNRRLWPRGSGHSAESAREARDDTVWRCMLRRIRCAALVKYFSAERCTPLWYDWRCAVRHTLTVTVLLCGARRNIAFEGTVATIASRRAMLTTALICGRSMRRSAHM